MNNYKVLYSLRVLKKILTTFVDSFLVLYFLDVSDSNILPLAIYKLVAIVSIYAVFLFTRNLAKSKHRINLLRIGIILDFIYFLTIILLKDKIVDYIYLVGMLYGLEEGFYYSVYNMIESDGVTNDERSKFLGSYTAISSILSIIFPLIFGSLIYATGFLKSLIIVLIIIALRIVLSFMFKDKNIPKSKKCDMMRYFKLTENNKRLKYLYKSTFYDALTFSESAFSYIVTIYVIKVFSNSFSLGVFTSIFNVITFIIGILYIKCLKKEYYPVTLKVFTVLTVLTLILMVFYCNPVTIVVFNLFQTIFKSLLDLMHGNSQSDLSNLDLIKKEYKVEYWLLNETYLFFGRVLSALIFILMAFTDSALIILVFVIFMVLYAYNLIKLQQATDEEKVVPRKE